MAEVGIRWICGHPTPSGWCHAKVASSDSACTRHGGAGLAALEWAGACVLRRTATFNLVCLVHEVETFDLARALGAEAPCDQLLSIWRETSPQNSLQEAEELEGPLASFAERAQAAVDEEVQQLEAIALADAVQHWSAVVRQSVAEMAENGHRYLLAQLAYDPAAAVRRAVAGNSATSLDVLREMTQDQDVTVQQLARQTMRLLLQTILEGGRDQRSPDKPAPPKQRPQTRPYPRWTPVPQPNLYPWVRPPGAGTQWPRPYVKPVWQSSCAHPECGPRSRRSA